MVYSKIKIKGSVRRTLLRELHIGAAVAVIVKTKKIIFRNGVKIKDKNSKKMTVAFGHLEYDICYFNLTCETIEKAIMAHEALHKRPYDPDELPF